MDLAGWLRRRVPDVLTARGVQSALRTRYKSNNRR